MKTRIETIIQGKRFVARAVKLHDDNVGFHIYDYPDVNGLPESRVTKLAQEFGLENSKNFIWYGKDHFERIQAELDRIDRRDRYTPRRRDRYTPRNGINGRPNMSCRAVITEVGENPPIAEHHVPLDRLVKMIGDHSSRKVVLDDDDLQQMLTHVSTFVETKDFQVVHNGQAMTIDEQRVTLALLQAVLPMVRNTESA